VGIKVRATKRGEYKTLKEEGDEFEVEFERHFSENWMERISGAGKADNDSQVQDSDNEDTDLEGDQAVAINNALDQLDPENNDHWTKDDKPKMSVIEDIIGDKSITRGDVEAVRPGFSRDSA
jgi:hypothetical protein